MGVSFLTPLGALFALAALLPLGAFALAQRRASAVRRLFSLPLSHRRELIPATVALALLPALLGVAATQPVVVRQEATQERSDAQALFVFDTSLSMSARAAANAPTRLSRAKREALRLEEQLGDIPAGVAVMTDRTLPVLMPTTDFGLFRRTLRQSVFVNSPPPSLVYRGRATTFQALTSVRGSQFFPHGVTHAILIVFTDGESSTLPPAFHLTFRPEDRLPVLAVHTWIPGERIYVRRKPLAGYSADPSSTGALRSFALFTGGREFSESQLGQVEASIRAATAGKTTTTTITHYVRVALAPWFVLACALPLGFLLWRRNV